MRMKWGFPSCGLLCASILWAQTTPTQQSGVPQPKPATSSETIRTQTRLIAVDVVVLDSHGDPVRGLKKDDFQIFEEHNRQQAIAKFEFVDLLASGRQSAGDLASATIFSNELSGDPTIAPTVLLMDALNTDISNQVRVRQKMLSLLKTLSSTTPVAVFSLSHTLRIMQSFSTDPSVLRAAVDKTLRSVPIEQNPQDDADSPSNQALDLNGGQENQATRALEDFEAMTYEAQMAIRVDETTSAMIQIAKYLGGYSGRKNLIWFSEAFPSWIEPSADFGSNPFNGSASYGDKIRAAAEALTDARVAVYPVDAQGLAVDQLYSTAQNPHINRQNAGAGFAGQLTRQNAQRLDQQGTMDDVAETTGGRTCKNTNDLSGCVQSALRDGAVYYELGYYPEGIAWDGRFHKILIKTTEHGLKLTYRRGYFATEPQSSAARQNPQDLLKQACASPLPSTSIALKVLPIEPEQSRGPATQPAPSRYLLNVSPSGLSFQMVEGLRHLDLQMAICEFDPEGNSFQFFSRDLSRAVPDDVFRAWQEQGIRSIFDYAAKPDDLRLRFAVLDVPSGEMGSLDVPAHPRKFAMVPAAEVPATSRAAAARPEPEKNTSQVATKITFHTGTATSWLDWSGDALSYHGDIGIEQGAPAFFKSLYSANFHCEGGKLIGNDPGSDAKPSYLLTFRNPAGPGALVELGGDAPAYSGNLQVDASARRFFDYLWKLCHCRAP
jgi:VWFA-related protein